MLYQNGLEQKMFHSQNRKSNNCSKARGMKISLAFSYKKLFSARNTEIFFHIIIETKKKSFKREEIIDMTYEKSMENLRAAKCNVKMAMQMEYVMQICSTRNLPFPDVKNTKTENEVAAIWISKNGEIQIITNGDEVFLKLGNEKANGTNMTIKQENVVSAMERVTRQLSGYPLAVTGKITRMHKKE